MKPPKRNGYIKSSTIILIAFASLFFARCLDTLGAPSPVNFLHFVTVPFALGTVLVKSRTTSIRQSHLVTLLLGSCFLLLIVTLASALSNDAGAINAFLSFLLLGEPYLMLVALMMLPIGAKSIETVRTWLYRFMFFHIGLALVQRYLLRMHLWTGKGLIGGDHIQGVFYKSGAGHVVGASVAFTFGIYYFFSAKDKPLWLRGLVLFLSFWQVVISDAKQVLLCFIIAGALLLLTKAKNLFQAVQYLIGGTLLISILWWCTQNVEAFEAYNVWARPELYGPDGNATIAKLSAIYVIRDFFTSPFNWLFGLGPGHTVGRLGCWMLHDYEDLLQPLGSTTHQACVAVWRALGDNPKIFHLVASSSLFSPFFGWVAVWGDIGFLGLAAYLTMGAIVWKYVCVDDAGRFFLLTVIVFGLIFTQMEEPGYTVTIAFLLGLRWHQAQAETRQKKLAALAKLKAGLQETAPLQEQNLLT